MGLIKTQELDNGNIGLEITYGGRESPFGGIDASSAPQYIDPKCATDIQGFTIVENQLVAVALNKLSITLTLPSGSVWNTPHLSGFGNFYTAAAGYQNFVLLKGQDTASGGVGTMTLALYVWPSSNTAIVAASLLQVSQPIITAPGSPAVAVVETSLGHVGHPPTLPIAQVTVTIVLGATTETYGPYASTMSQNAFATQLVSDITTLPSTLVTAALGADTVSVVLTTIAVGTLQNSMQVNLLISPSGAVQFPGFVPYIASEFQGGTNNFAYPSGIGPYPLSFVSEGEQLILGGPGTAILQYNLSTFSVLTQYLGANILRKFGGSLLALGVTPSPGTVISSAEMVFAWSATGKFGIWNPTDSSGNVTGAGFEQLADIEDYLSGGFVNSSTLVMLRAKGVSYASLSGNATLPFPASHVDLAPEGEGCQGQLLNSQYGPVGFYVGNSNIFSFIQQMQPIGDKIKSMLFTQLSPLNTPGAILACSKAVSFFINTTEALFFAVLVKPYLYLYNVEEGAWTRVNVTLASTVTDVYMENFPLLSTSTNQFQKQSQLVLGTGDPTNKNFFFYSLQESVCNTQSLNANASIVLFPQEEISFGRDITIDGIYVNVAGTAGQVINFDILNQAGTSIWSGTLTLPVGATYGILQNYQVFNSSTGEANTCQAPQLKITIPVTSGSGFSQLRIAKVSVFGSFDPTQRPV